MFLNVNSEENISKVLIEFFTITVFSFLSKNQFLSCEKQNREWNSKTIYSLFQMRNSVTVYRRKKSFREVERDYRKEKKKVIKIPNKIKPFIYITLKGLPYLPDYSKQ